MIRNSLLLSLLVTGALVVKTVGEIKPYITVKIAWLYLQATWPYVLGFLFVLLVNMTSGLSLFLRKVAQQGTGDKLRNVDRQMRTSGGVSAELSQRLLEQNEPIN